MTRSLKVALALMASAVLTASGVPAQSASRFTDASANVPELIELYRQSDSGCRLARSRDVKVVVACLSRSIYGSVLNERGWCFGKQDQANAEMAWHECQAGSLRFPPFDLSELEVR